MQAAQLSINRCDCVALVSLSLLFSPIITSLREKYFFYLLSYSRREIHHPLPYYFHRLRNLSSEGEDNILSLFYKQDTTAAAVARFSIKLPPPPPPNPPVSFLSRKTYDCLLPRVYRGTSEPIKGCRWDCQSARSAFSFSREKLASLRLTVIAIPKLW